jgi:SAM-dependent methyltransferase
MTMTDTALVCAADGPLDVAAKRWISPVGPADLSVIARTRGPALDVGCGPGRHVVALAERGIRAMGIDITPSALAYARTRGAPVLERSVFDRIPAAGRWGSALLLDGNIGIGGNPVVLLERVASLIRADGRILVELDPPGTPLGERTVRLDVGNSPGPWFVLARVGTDGLDALARDAGLRVSERWSLERRWFASLTRDDR